jgi:hypothetical protein
MLGLFTKRKQPSASDAARILAAARGQSDRELRRSMANQIRADLRAKGREDMQPIDWSAL